MLCLGFVVRSPVSLDLSTPLPVSESRVLYPNPVSCIRIPCPVSESRVLYPNPVSYIRIPCPISESRVLYPNPVSYIRIPCPVSESRVLYPNPVSCIRIPCPVSESVSYIRIPCPVSDPVSCIRYHVQVRGNYFEVGGGGGKRLPGFKVTSYPKQNSSDLTHYFLGGVKFMNKNKNNRFLLGKS